MNSGKKKTFDSLVTGKSSVLEDIKWRQNNEAWLDESAKIAYLVLSELKKQGMTKTELALVLNVSAQYISKLVKGQENLTLETICKLQKVLGVKIISDHCLQKDEIIISNKYYATVVKMASIKRSVAEPQIRKLLKSRQVLENGTSLAIPVNAENLYEQEVAK